MFTTRVKKEDVDYIIMRQELLGNMFLATKNLPNGMVDVTFLK